MTIGLGHYLSVGAILFTLGILGIFLNRKNIIVILMSIELMLLAVNINLPRMRMPVARQSCVQHGLISAACCGRWGSFPYL